MLRAAGDELGFDVASPLSKMSQSSRHKLFYGDDSRWIEHPGGWSFQYLGVFPGTDRALRATPQLRGQLGQVLSDVQCSSCGGSRLCDESQVVRLWDRTIGEVCQLPVGDLDRWFREQVLTADEQEVAGEVFSEITNRVRFLKEVGLEYVSLNRSAPSLSGGEAQRIRLAGQIGSGLTGVLYVLDEPTIGLHPRDNRRLLGALKQLRDLHNTVVLVEHDRDTLEAADHIVDFGPGAGAFGGEVVGTGTQSQLRKEQKSLTGQYLEGTKQVAVPQERREGTGHTLCVRGAMHNNLNGIDVAIPLGTMTVVTGVSGSGKSSLVNDIIYKALAAKLHRAQTVPALHDEITGIEHLDKIINIDQQPIGTTPRSNSATYLGVFDHFRRLYAELPESKVRGYGARRFSFNVPGGRCETCRGMGFQQIEMHFLPDVWVDCPNCGGMRYNSETLEIAYRGMSIGSILNMSAQAALAHFENIPRIRKQLQTLVDVGLGYMSLGQSAPTMSGGEAQRVKLGRELARPATGRTLYLLDEPTTGLHPHDVLALLGVLQRLVDKDNTVVMIEHNMDVIKSADWVIDLGPEGGDLGGELVAEGTPEDVAAVGISHTGAILNELLSSAPRPASAKPKEMIGDVDAPEPDEESDFGGKEWHMAQRVTEDNRNPVWNSSCLKWLIEQLELLGHIEIDWSHTDHVDVSLNGGGNWLTIETDRWESLPLVFEVPGGVFADDDLAFDLPVWDEVLDLPTYGNDERVTVQPMPDDRSKITVLACRKSELDTDSFKQFLAKSHQACLGVR